MIHSYKKNDEIMFNADFLKEFGDIKNKIENNKIKVAETDIEAEAGGNLIQITMSGDRKLKALKINTDLSSMDVEDLEDLLSVALKRALDEANELNERLVGNATNELFPNI
jgi:DNA-binding protein YbaB